MPNLTDHENRIQALEAIIQSAVIIPKSVLDISDSSVTDKTNRWVRGKDVPGINSGGAFEGFSTVPDPTLDAHLTNKTYK